MPRLSLRWLALAAALAASAQRASTDEAAKPAALDPKLRTDLIKGGRNYLNPAEDADPFNGRQVVRGVIEKSQAAGIDFLGRLDLLRDLAYQGRGFLPDYQDKKWQKLQPNTEVKDGKYSVNVAQGDKLRLAYSVPKKDYVEANLTKMPRVEPFPTLVTLIEEKDYGKPWPGDEAIGRRYGAVPAFKEVMEKWIVFAPVAVRGKYVEVDPKDGSKLVRQIFFGDQLKSFYQRYHVDFERMVLDGDANSVLTIAAWNPFSFAGILVRKPLAGAAEVDRDLVVNYSTVPVFVLGDEALAATLKEAGHPNVKSGGDAEAMTWLKELPKRTTATTFKWNAKTSQQTLAHWLILNPDWNASKRTLDVTVLNTKEDPNTIKIEAHGMLDFSALLSDEIVPLAGEVRIVVNGKEVSKQRYERSLEQTFERDPVKVRDSMYYGLLFPAVTARIFPPPPPKPATTPAGGGGTKPPATGEGDAKAEELLKKGEDALADGNAEAAKKYFEVVVQKYPDSPSAPKAKEALAKIK
jgi:hypothetical protein